MPLPGNGVFSLQGHSKPGDTQCSKPKQAMIVRMSSETLDALDGQAKMQFEFGDSPGIHIGDTFFPMKPVKESSPHELYLRASSAARPNVPLRLNAIITGKFLVERELDPKVQDKVRDRTIQAEKQRTERATIILENGLPPPKPPKALKKAKNITRRIPPVSSTPVPVRPPKKLSPLPQSLTDRDATVRTRVVHCLALKHRNTFEVARLVGLSDDIIDELNVLLDEVANQTHHLQTTGERLIRWKLKPMTWKEVRPLEWPNLSTSERTALCLEAARAFESLKILPSDPCWNHIRQQEPKSNGSSSGAGSSTELPPKPEPRKPIMSSGQSKQKKKTDVPSKRASDTITAKDERVKQPRVDTVKSREKTADESSGAGTPTSAKPVIARRLPGSGFKAKAGSLTPTPPAHDPIRAGSQPPKRSAQSDVRDVKMEVSSPLPSSISLSRSSLPSTSVSQAPASHALPKKPKDPQGTTATPRTQESREKDRKVSPSQSSTSTAGFKRKPKEEPDSEYSERDVSNGSTMLKRRKIGDGQPLRDRQQKEGDRGREREYESERPPERMKGKERDPSLPKKPVMQDASSMPPPRMTRIKREGSPISVKRSPHPPTRSPLPPAHSPTRSTSGRSPLPPSTHSPIPSNRSPMPYGRSPLVSHQSPAKPSVADRTVSGSSSLHKRTSSGAKAADRERENERGRDRERPAHAHRANGSAKPRRKSPIYTSSEDESSHPSAPDPTSSAALRRGVDGGGDDSARSISTSSSLSSGPPAKSKMLSRRTKKPLELPDTAEGLRKLYEAKYPKYMKLFYQHFEAVHTIKRMLSKDLDEATDSEIDAELLSPDQILMLKEEFETAERELKMIRNAHAKLRKVTAAGTGSDVE